ncbi:MULTISPECIES: mercury(II) reductase [Cellulomonadaceae]|uniref:Mercuric reductase n=1 Tax=Cellulomonas carbonis T26 TaxID=947969 RepID=A0A0A0BYM3_9CELL|nr:MULTISPECIES: mercury(II) reductase [Cellulomonadaceae]KGM12767.1 mercuric reductase [Cellulomonas carbonis T26]MDT0166632.1 mercury(II) reductase [Actinotalea sp. AC32]GGC14288.1 mercuric reductase [Cellulomonas carbonis]
MSAGHDVDLAVVGSGGAAMAAAITARQAGHSVVLIERGVLGGTCVNIGCVPSKTLLAAAGARHSALTNPFDGAPTSAGGVDLRALVQQKDELIEQLRGAKYADVAAAYGFEVVPGHAGFLDRDTLAVEGTPLRAQAYVVATGAEPAVPELAGLDGVDWLTSTTAMELDQVPRSLVLIGGGYVGLEQAQLFAHLGARVSLVGRVAPRAEPELAERLRAVFADDGIGVLEEHAVAVSVDGGEVVVRTASGVVVRGERLLIATGRAARTDGLGLAAAGVDVDERGFVVTDEFQRTTNPRVYAAGDVSGAPQYVYVAAAAGRAAAANALAGPDGPGARVDYTGLPTVVFTNPQLASAGLSEKEALERGHDCTSRVLNLSEVPRALVNRDTRGTVKIVADAATGKVLGVHALADSAGEIMLAATYAIRAGMTVDDIADTWAPYLTMAESLRIAAGLFRNQMPTSCCA